MKQLWVSRLAYDTLESERDRLVEQNKELIESLTRVKRFEAGMTETPRAPRKALEPMPEALNADIMAGSDGGIRRMRRSTYMKRNVRGESWDSIMADVLPNERDEHAETT